MHNFKIRATAFLLIVFQLLILASCAGGDGLTDNTSSTGEDTSPVPLEIPLLSESGAPIYTIVRPEKASKDLLTAAARMRSAISDAAGKSFSITDDWVKNPEDIDEESFEILIGKTNRAASIAAAEGLALRDYRIRVSGNKIVICGGSDEATVAALEVFIEKYLDLSGAPKVILPEDIEYRHSYAVKEATIDGLPISQFTIVYSMIVEPEEGIEIAEHLRDTVADLCGVEMKLEKDTVNRAGGEHEIIIGKVKRDESTAIYSNSFGTFDYKIEMQNGKLLLAGGSTFALYYAVELLGYKYITGGLEITSSINESGSMYGKNIYKRADGTELRIMSNNVWNCDNNQPAWQAIGEDCSAKVRSVGLAGVYMAYLPDVICFQEMSITMINLIQRELKNNGYSYKLLSGTKNGIADNTCILYREDTIKLMESEHYLFTYGNNGNSKGYTWGHFELIATGEDFIALSTHMWWKSESAEPGSDELRRRQAAEIVAKADTLIAKYDCPVFVLGDFNTRTTSTAFAEFNKGGFKTAFSLAELYASNLGGHHTCGPEGFARETGTTTYAANSIDHIILKNPGETRILTFNHVRPYFYIKLSDHYPIFSDVILG